MHSRLSAVFSPVSLIVTLCLPVAILVAAFPPRASAQQTLGSMNGTVTDSSGAVVQKADVSIRNAATNLKVTATTKDDGSFSVADLPIGAYEVTFSKQGFQTAVFPQIVVQGHRTATVNAQLKPGTTSESVTVNATPLLNATDTTTGVLCQGWVSTVVSRGPVFPHFLSFKIVQERLPPKPTGSR